MKLFIHPGFHKTATTFLQKSVFSDAAIFNSLGTPEQISHLIERPHPLVFDCDLVRRDLDRVMPLSSDRINILSSETLCGNPFFGSRDAVETAARLCNIYPEAHILFTVRHQRSAASSLYKQYIKMGGNASPQDFFDPDEVPQFYFFDPITLDYGRTVEAYANLFGGRVCVLPYELLKQRPAEFFDQLGEYMGFYRTDLDAPAATQSVSPSSRQVAAYRYANLFSHSPINPDMKIGPQVLGRAIRFAANRFLTGSKPATCPISDAFEKVNRHDFAAGNRTLQKFCPVPLDQFGYHVSS
ncbi:sulfotransferase [Erythrobacter insulae]|uniref:Sulfotransferase n=1 Tax=Erythrobacter insulae TaxID=2584124 RepID=A0A547PBZ6_9SPHN|nr:sulfotransferase [Erythrobacter insulae]TRD11660.1 sulfotransferase [Erythrobacter insulae]